MSEKFNVHMEDQRWTVCVCARIQYIINCVSVIEGMCLRTQEAEVWVCVEAVCRERMLARE